MSLGPRSRLFLPFLDCRSEFRILLDEVAHGAK